MPTSLQALKAETLRKLEGIPSGDVASVYKQKAELFKQLQKRDPKVDLICGFYADKANGLMRDKPKTGDAADFALMYLFSNPPGYYTDVVDGIEQYLRTGKLPKEVADIQKLARK